MAAALAFALLPFARGPGWDHSVGAIAALLVAALAAAGAGPYPPPGRGVRIAVAAMLGVLVVLLVAFAAVTFGLRFPSSPGARSALPPPSSAGAAPPPTRSPAASPARPSPSPPATTPLPAASPAPVPFPSPFAAQPSPAPPPALVTIPPPPSSPPVPDSAALYGTVVFAAGSFRLVAGQEFDYGGPAGDRFAADLELEGGSDAGFQLRWLVAGEEVQVDLAARSVGFGSALTTLPPGAGPLTLLLVDDGTRLTLRADGTVIGQLGARPGSAPAPRLVTGAGPGSVGVLAARVYTLGTGDG
ncbi:MAG: hypothetical protein NVS9B1_25190 [Candidatus Dormibacteraceae bacterium]